jgi:hypothetical protein
MHIQLKRVYEIKFDGTAAQFIKLVDREYMLVNDTDIGIDSLDMGDAVYAATQLFQSNGSFADIIDEIDAEYDYIDCPDKGTLLSLDGGIYKVVPGSDSPDHRSPHQIAWDTITQGRRVIPCAPCKQGHVNDCWDEGHYSGWICPTQLQIFLTLHFQGIDQLSPSKDDYESPIDMKGWHFHGRS